MVLVQLLGPVDVQVDRTSVDIGHAKQRAVLAILAAETGRAVSTDHLVTLLWGSDAPSRARTTLHTYLTRLRQALVGTGVGIERRNGGYRLAVDPASIDLYRFEQLTARAESTTDDAAAADLWEQALALWRGEPFSGLDVAWLRQKADGLRTRRLMAELNRNAARIRMGRHLGLLAGLEELAAAHPLDERVAEQHMTVLHAAGRTGDALEVYRELRARMVERLGHEPARGLRDLHRRILTADTPVTAAPVPRQLPQVPRSFFGRDRELRTLNDDDEASVWLITGPGGTGKSWLAAHWAHQVADRFPDGQLYVDLRGFDPVEEPRSAQDALLEILVALGVAGSSVPAGIDARSGRFRSLVAERRMLLVLENVAEPDQLVPLLPGGRTCVTLVTSRNRLTSVAARFGARQVQVDRMNPEESTALLTSHLGWSKVAEEPDAVAELVEYCDRLPLALSIIGGYAAAHPGFALSELVDELAPAGTRLDILDEGGLQAGVRAALTGSLRRLTKEAAAAFELCGVAPGSSWDRHALASLTGLPLRETRVVLAELEQAHLIEQYRPGRFRMHDLTRLYAADRAADRCHLDALRRQVDYYLHSAARCCRLSGGTVAVELDEPAQGCDLPLLAERGAAIDWLETEAVNLAAAQRVAAANGWDAAWQLVLVVASRWMMHGWLEPVVTMAELALETVESASATEQAHFYSVLAQAHAVADRPEEAARYALLARRRAEASSDVDAVRRAHYASGNLAAQQGAYGAAVDHFEVALRIARDRGQVGVELALLNALGWCCARQDRYAEAMRYCDAALRLIGNESTPADPVIGLMHEGQLLDTQGVVHHRRGRFRRAVGLHRAAIERFERMRRNDPKAGSVTEADSHENLGDVYRSMGEPDRAVRSWARAAELYRAQHRYDAATRVVEKSRTERSGTAPG